MRTVIWSIGAILFLTSRVYSAGVDGSVWFYADDVYDSCGSKVVGAQQAGNVFQSGGALHIVARKQTVQCLPTKGGARVTQDYTIGAVYTKKFNFTYGDVDVRAKMTGPGTWPAAWLIGACCQSTYWVVLPSPYWADGWEIDFAEYKPGNSNGSVNKIWQNVKSKTGAGKLSRRMWPT